MIPESPERSGKLRAHRKTPFGVWQRGVICAAAAFLMLILPRDALALGPVVHTGDIVESQTEDCLPEEVCPADPRCNTFASYCSSDELRHRVTNTRPDLAWDADDYGFAQPSHHFFADWMPHVWQFWACRKGQSSGILTIHFEPQGMSRSVSVPKGRGCFQSCVYGLDYDRSNPYLEAVPSQGGFGTKVGRAIPTTVTAAFTGRGTASVNPYNIGTCAAILTCEGDSINSASGKLCWPQ